MTHRPFDNEYVNQLAEEIDDSEVETVYTVVLQGLDENDLPTQDKETVYTTKDYDAALQAYEANKAAGAPVPDDPKTKYYAIRLDAATESDAWTNNIENLWLD